MTGLLLSSLRSWSHWMSGVYPSEEHHRTPAGPSVIYPPGKHFSGLFGHSTALHHAALWGPSSYPSIMWTSALQSSKLSQLTEEDEKLLWNNKWSRSHFCYSGSQRWCSSVRVCRLHYHHQTHPRWWWVYTRLIHSIPWSGVDFWRQISAVLLMTTSKSPQTTVNYHFLSYTDSRIWTLPKPENYFRGNRTLNTRTTTPIGINLIKQLTSITICATATLGPSDR